MSEVSAAHDHPPGRKYSSERWHRASSGASLRNFVFGASDGLVTVLAFVAGVAASLKDARLVLLAGIAEMFAGAISMGLGAFLGSRAERDLYEREREREEREVHEVPHLERDELREIYRKKGFSGPQLESAIDTLTATRERWVDVMMAEELGLQPITEPPWRAGLIVGVSYVVAAAVPLFPYLLFHGGRALAASLVTTSLALLGVGWAKSVFTQRSLWRGAIETLAMGLTGTAVCYGIGQLASRLMGHGT